MIIRWRKRPLTITRRRDAKIQPCVGGEGPRLKLHERREAYLCSSLEFYAQKRKGGEKKGIGGRIAVE